MWIITWQALERSVSTVTINHPLGWSARHRSSSAALFGRGWEIWGHWTKTSSVNEFPTPVMAHRPGHHSREHAPQPIYAGLTQFLFTLHDGEKQRGKKRDDKAGRRHEKKEGKRNNHLAGVHFCWKHHFSLVVTSEVGRKMTK